MLHTRDEQMTRQLVSIITSHSIGIVQENKSQDAQRKRLAQPDKNKIKNVKRTRVFAHQNEAQNTKSRKATCMRLVAVCFRRSCRAVKATGTFRVWISVRRRCSPLFVS